MRVAVIGAGAVGLGAVKTCLDEGLSPECFEIKDGLGGVWNYLETPVVGQPSCFWSTVTNTSKEAYCYSDFPCPDDFPNFLHHTKLLEYLKMYAKKFDLEKYIRYRTEVLEIAQTEDFKTTGQWTVKTKDLVTGIESTKIFDAVLVCNGNHSKPFTPHFEGSKEFQGQQLHSHFYRTGKEFENKRVLIVGFGNTAGDIAAELSHVCSQVYMSTRSGSWITTRTIDGGLPTDFVLIRRSLNALPGFLKGRILANKLNSIFDQSLYGVKPKNAPHQQTPFICDELSPLLASHRIILKPNVRCFTKSGVVFEDGSAEENIDAIIYATGYTMDTSFIKHPSYKVSDDNEINLYKFVFAPDVKPHTLAIIGYLKPNNAVISLAELQYRWAVNIFKGLKSLPSEDQMKNSIRKRREEIRSLFPDSVRYTTAVEWIDYMDEIAKEIDCKPDYIRLLLSDPRLALAVFFGPCLPSHYRLQGRGSWPGARQTILGNWDRVTKSFQIHRRVNNDQGHHSYAPWVLAFGMALIAVYFCLM